MCNVTLLTHLAAAGVGWFDIQCSRCPRRGRYRVATLIGRFGGSCDVLVELSRDCPRRQQPHPSVYEMCDPFSPTFGDYARMAPPRPRF